MTTPAPVVPKRFLSLRELSNIVMLLLLLAGADYAWAWWKGTSTFACGLLLGLGTEGALASIGTIGLLIAILGVTLGGVKHWLTAFGLVVMVFGLIAIGVLGESIGRACM
jgi:hypothetical protein